MLDPSSARNHSLDRLGHLGTVCIPVTGHMERGERSERITTREQLDHRACHIGKVGPLVPDTPFSHLHRYGPADAQGSIRSRAKPSILLGSPTSERPQLPLHVRVSTARTGPEPVDRTGAPTHPVPVIRDIGHEIEYVGTRKLVARDTRIFRHPGTEPEATEDNLGTCYSLISSSGRLPPVAGGWAGLVAFGLRQNAIQVVGNAGSAPGALLAVASFIARRLALG